MKAYDKTVAITGIGIITPAIYDISDIDSYCKSVPDTLPKKVGKIPPPSEMNARELRRMAPLTKLALYATDKLFRESTINRDSCGLYIGLTHGTTSLLKEFHDYLFDYGPSMVSPNAFSNGVTNAPLGAVSKYNGLTQGGGTLVGYENCGLLTLNQAAFSIVNGIYECCCAGAAEEYSQLVEEAYKKIEWYDDNVEKPEYLPYPQNNSASHRKALNLSEAGVFFNLTKPENVPDKSDNNYCFYCPIDDLDSFNEEVDIIISGAGAGPQDEYELKALSLILPRLDLPTGILFSKPFFGETFAPGSLLSSAIAWDILINKKNFPSFPLHAQLKEGTANISEIIDIKRILVIAASRDGEVTAGLFSKILV